MNCSQDLNVNDLGYFDINVFCERIFKNDYQEPKSLYFTIDESTLHSTLIYILLKATEIIFNLTDINTLTIYDFELLQHYFNSFGFKILYEPILTKNDVDAYNVGFLPI